MHPRCGGAPTWHADDAESIGLGVSPSCMYPSCWRFCGHLTISIRYNSKSDGNHRATVEWRSRNRAQLWGIDLQRIEGVSCLWSWTDVCWFVEKKDGRGTWRIYSNRSGFRRAKLDGHLLEVITINSAIYWHLNVSIKAHHEWKEWYCQCVFLIICNTLAIANLNCNFMH